MSALKHIVEDSEVANATDKTLTEGVDSEINEDINISVDGAEAEELIQRIASLAGSDQHSDAIVQAPSDGVAINDMSLSDEPITASDQAICDQCNCAMSDCQCNASDDNCETCSQTTDNCQCAPADGITAEIDADEATMENADYDVGTTENKSKGQQFDFKNWEPDQEPQRRVKAMSGDNPLIKEDAVKLLAKLRNDYKAYIAEAEAANNEAGTASPLTANSRDKFEKDPFAEEDIVDDGSHSPMSTIERQDVDK